MFPIIYIIIILIQDKEEKANITYQHQWEISVLCHQHLFSIMVDPELRIYCVWVDHGWIQIDHSTRIHGDFIQWGIAWAIVIIVCYTISICISVTGIPY